MLNSSTGKILIIAGILLLLAGLIVYFFSDKLNWFGKLPGDIRVERDDFNFYFPITTMILLSIFVSVILYLFNRFIR